MIDELREEEIVNKVGGRFKLSTLIQKRLVALNSGRTAVDRSQHRQQAADRHSRNHAGQDLPRRFGQPANHRRAKRSRRRPAGTRPGEPVRR